MYKNVRSNSMNGTFFGSEKNLYMQVVGFVKPLCFKFTIQFWTKISKTFFDVILGAENVP